MILVFSVVSQPQVPEDGHRQLHRLEISKIFKSEVVDRFAVLFWVYAPCVVHSKEDHSALCGSCSACGLGQRVTEIEEIRRDPSISRLVVFAFLWL